MVLLPMLFSKMRFVFYLGIWERHDIWISEKLKFDYLKNKKTFWSEMKDILLVSQVLFFRLTKKY